MEAKFAKVSDSPRRLMVNLKRKRAAQSKAQLPQSPLISSPHTVNKRMKLDRSKSLLNYYSNFKKSGPPQRLMCYKNGEWTDFSQDVVSSVKKDFEMKKAAIEIELDGQLFVFDFLHMMKLDLQTGIQQPIAWIDEMGTCFFPETFEETNECCYQKVPDAREYDDIKLQLEIDITGLDFSNLKESSGETNDIVRQIKVIQKPASTDLDAEADNNSCVRVSNEEAREVFGENQEENLVRVDPFQGKLDSDTVKGMFLTGLGSFKNANVAKISSGSSVLMQARRELFQKQVEITAKYRGDANVRYAWLPSSKEALSSVMTYGLGDSGLSKIKPTNGIGVLLFPANCIQSSASYCDIDENGLRHMILCCVIMGIMEVVPPGSTQIHPSCEVFDSGVDDLDNPRQYIVWDMKKNTHILPQYVVSFMVSSSNEGFLAGNENKLDSSGVTTSGSAHIDDRHQVLVPVPKLQNIAANLGSSATRTPKSPWMPFPMLFAAIANEVSPHNMNLIGINYELFRSRKINRDDFVRRLRTIVGDALLRTTITNLRSKGSSTSNNGEVEDEQVGSI